MCEGEAARCGTNHVYHVTLGTAEPMVLWHQSIFVLIRLRKVNLEN